MGKYPTSSKHTLVIPAYNEETYLNKYRKLYEAYDEVIIVANACTDKTQKIARQVGKCIITNEANVSLARNTGAKNATYENITFIDADIKPPKPTLAEPGKIKIFLGESESGEYNIYFFIKNFCLKYLKLPWTHASIVIRKEDYLGFDENQKVGEWKTFFKRHENLEIKTINQKVKVSTRRLQKWKLIKMILFWLKKNKNDKYEAIR